MKFSTWGLTYQDACSLIEAFKKGGIDANITAGGISICPEPQQISKMHEICKVFGATAVIGNTLHQEMILNPVQAKEWIKDCIKSQLGEGHDI